MKKLFFLLMSAAAIHAQVASGTAPRRVQSSFPKYPAHTITAMGDSHTLNYTLSVLPSDFYPEVAAVALRKSGCAVKARNFGISGNTTAQMVARMTDLNRFDTPDIGIIYAGANDAAGGITNRTETNLRILIKGFKFGATNAVATEASLPASGIPGTRYVVEVDGGLNGGAASYGGFATTLTGAGGGAMTVWECRNQRGSTNGWGRVAIQTTAPTHCSRIVIVGMHYLNYSTGGDSSSTPVSYPGIRTYQQNAVTAENGNGATVIYVDTYALMRALIVSGQETQGSFSWHYADSNTHLNALGNAYIGKFVADAITAQSGWVAALKL